MRKVIGAGGGGKGPSGGTFAVKEDSDSLKSNAAAALIDLVCEGPIEGLVNGIQSVYLDDTPVIDSNGVPNFKNIQVITREGTQDQDVIPGFPLSESPQNVNALVTNALPVVRTIDNELVDAVRIIISFPTLTKSDTTTGNLGGSEVSFKIEVNSNGAGYVQVANDTINGKTTSKYQKQYWIPLSDDGPHNIRVSRVTPDADSVSIQDKMYWDSYVEIIEGKYNFPNSALIACRVDAANFTSIPRRSYDLKLLKIKVPSNYDPESRVYSTEIWSGDFQILWTDNPAWILYDLLTNERYGCGIAESDVDKWALYEIGRYCDQLVDDGFGGKEPRFTLNCYIQSRVEAYSLIRDLSTVFRGISYWQGGILNFSIDAPQDPEFIFNNSNVIDGNFSYQGTSKKNRYNVALVTWNDPDDLFKQKIEYVEDPDGIARYGVIQSEVYAFGCTSRGQANRVGRWLLQTSRSETEVVNFEAGPDAGRIALGQVILIADDMRAGNRPGGRVKTATINTVQVDADLVLNLNTTEYTFYVMVPSGEVVQRTVTGYANRIVTLDEDLPAVPHDHAIWAISNPDVELQYFRIASIGESNGKYQISALKHDPDKYAAVEDGLIIPERSITNLSVTPAAPANLKVTETLYDDNGEVKVKATFSWDSAAGAASYFPSYRKEFGNVINLSEVRANEIEVLAIEEGTYTFSVVSASALGIKSTKTSLDYDVQGKTLAPGDVQEFSIIPTGGNLAEASWLPTVDLDVSKGGFLRIRLSDPDSGSPSWQNAVDVALVPGNSTRCQIPLKVGTYWAKFVDSSGNYSENAASLYTDILEGKNLNVIETMTEHPAFTGTKINMSYIAELGGLCLTGESNLDDVTDVDSLPSVDFAGGVTTEGSYETAYFDQGEVYTSNVNVAIDAEAVDVTDKIDSREALVDTWVDFDGSNIDTVNAEVFMATTEDDPAGAPTWTSWKRFLVAAYKFRAIKFLVVAKSTASNHSIIIKKLEIVIDMPDREEWQNGVVSDVAGTVITYQKPFKAVPAISLSVKNLGIDERYAITGETVSGFTIRFFDSIGNGISRTFDYNAKGYGRKVN